MESLAVSQSAPVARGASGALRVLLMDEDPSDLAAYREALRLAGCVVRECGSHLAALQCLRNETFDLLMINEGLDRLAWRSVLEGATELVHPGLLLVLTRRVDRVSYLEAMQLGAVDYVEKPMSVSQLTSLLDKHLGIRN